MLNSREVVETHNRRFGGVRKIELANDEFLPFSIRPLTPSDAEHIAIRFAHKLSDALEPCRRENRDAIRAAIARGLSHSLAMRDILRWGSRLEPSEINALDDLALSRAAVAIVQLTKQSPGAMRTWRAGRTALRRFVGLTGAQPW